MSGRAQYPQLADEAWLREQYVAKERSCPEIAEELGCSPAAVELRLKNFGIPRRRRRPPNTRRLRPKICEWCEQEYQPVGPAQRLCDACWARPEQVCRDCGVTFILDYVPGRRKNRGWVPGYCPDCRARRRAAPAATRWAARRQPMADTGKFTCRDCQGQFPVDESIKDSSRASGYMERCPGCAAARMAGYLSDEDFLAAQRKRVRDCSYRKFGASVADYERLSVEQEGRCAVCGHKPELGEAILQFDHDHAGGRHRGLLCHPCNAALGYMMDDPARLRAAADYLELWQELRSVSALAQYGADNA